MFVSGFAWTLRLGRVFGFLEAEVAKIEKELERASERQGLETIARLGNLVLRSH